MEGPGIKREGFNGSIYPIDCINCCINSIPRVCYVGYLEDS